MLMRHSLKIEYFDNFNSDEEEGQQHDNPFVSPHNCKPHLWQVIVKHNLSKDVDYFAILFEFYSITKVP